MKHKRFAARALTLCQKGKRKERENAHGIKGLEVSTLEQVAAVQAHIEVPCGCIPGMTCFF